MTYEQLLTTADQNGLLVKEKTLVQHDGLLRGKRIAIRKDIETQAEKSCVLAEEIGHHCTSSGDILDQTDIMNRKQEYRARLYGYNLKVGLTGLISAYEEGCRNLYEMAEYLDVTEEYLRNVINCYHAKYGQYTIVDNYVIYFEPFAVMKMIAAK
ncbi:MAG: ImmA/IrrE family metallo-endopeptidase [Ruminococcus sp.]|nr:ImmA/IrrE family metallo-endopeptidase [Ruminococcus sp.]